MHHSYGRRPWTFYVLAALFTAFVIFLYGPMISIFILSFQGPNGGLVFPLKDPGIHWFIALFGQARTGDVGETKIVVSTRSISAGPGTAFPAFSPCPS